MWWTRFTQEIYLVEINSSRGGCSIIMYEIKDTYEDIALSRAISILIKYASNVFDENGIAEDMFRGIGLSDVSKQFSDLLNPYTFNGIYKNSNNRFNPHVALHSIVSMIKDNSIALNRFLKAYLERVKRIEEDDYNELSNNLRILGLDLEEEIVNVYDRESYKYVLHPLTEGTDVRRDDISYLSKKIEISHNPYLHYYKEAISQYGNSHYDACIGSCRIIIEKIFSDLDNTNNDHNQGFLIATGEKVPIGTTFTPKKSIKGIFEFWLSEKKGFNRYRLFVTIYSVLSGLGPHGEEIPSKEDALLCLRITEDMLIWAYQNNSI